MNLISALLLLTTALIDFSEAQRRGRGGRRGGRRRGRQEVGAGYAAPGGCGQGPFGIFNFGFPKMHPSIALLVWEYVPEVLTSIRSLSLFYSPV